MTCHARLALALCIAAAPAAAQSINLDLGAPGSEPFAGYRAAGLPGHWNKIEAVNPVITYPLVGLDGQPTAVTVRQYGGTEIVAAALGGAGDPVGADAVLLGDALVTHTTIENCLFFNGLQSGTYELTTYAWMPTVPATINQVHVDDATPGILPVGGAWSGGHTEGVTFARHYVEVFDGFLGPHSGVPPGGDFGIGAAMNGIQLRRLEPAPPLFPSSNRLTWLVSLGATSYDVVYGDLASLRSSVGNFTSATTGCLAEDLPATRIAYPPAVPAAGQAQWFVLRGSTPTGPETYDEPGSGQVGSRDVEIDASPVGCN